MIPSILEGVFSMVTAKDAPSFLGAFILTIIGLLLAPIFFIAGFLGISV